MLLTTQDKFEDFDIVQTLGVVHGHCTGKDNFVDMAVHRMLAQAESRGADGVAALRFSNAFAGGEIPHALHRCLAYGTAVKLKPKNPAARTQRKPQSENTIC